MLSFAGTNILRPGPGWVTPPKIIALYNKAYDIIVYVRLHGTTSALQLRIVVYQWFGVLTLDEVNSSMVDRSSTCLAAAIWDLRRSSFRSFCRSPVKWASSTISVPKWLKALTNSVKLLTPSNRPKLRDTYIYRKKMSRLRYSRCNILLLYYILSNT